MAIYSFRTSTYARNIYLYGITSFGLIPSEYRVPVMEYAVANYSSQQINEAYQKQYITTEEYQETLSYIPS
jgi:hypothetical protein